MKKYLLILLVLVLGSCAKEKNVPKEVITFSEKAIDESIDVYAMEDDPFEKFSENYFHESVTDEYKEWFKNNSIVWKGSEHSIVLREAKLISKNDTNADYLIKFWVTFADSRKFSYLLRVSDEDGTMLLKRFEPINQDIAGTFYAPRSSYDMPDYDSNKLQIYGAYILMFLTLIGVVVLAVMKKEFRWLLLSIPLIFVYKQGLSIYKYRGIEIIHPRTHFGIPSFQHIDLYFTNLSLTTTGVFYAWFFIALFFIGRRLFFNRTGIAQTE